MNLRKWLTDFWYVPTIDAMQARMLRSIPRNELQRKERRNRIRWQVSAECDLAYRMARLKRLWGDSYAK